MLPVRTFLSFILHRYPFYGGFETIALSKPLALFARTETYAIARLRNGDRMLVVGKDHVGRVILYMGDFEPRISYVAGRLLRPGNCVLDIGSNMGWFSMIASRMIGPSGEVHAFEPQPLMNTLLRASLGMNDIENVTIHQVALSNQNGTADLHILNGNCGAARLSEEQGELWSTVQIATVDTMPFLERLDLPPVRLMKIDVEGHEETVFNAAEPFFRKTPPDVVIFESAGAAPLLERPVAQILEQFGYALFSLDKAFRRPRLVPAKAGEQVPTIDHVALLKGASLDRDLELLGRD